jgi:cobalt-precorrin-5B (C1)-methyltransferase
MLRCGFTTGTCASLAASGAAQLLLTGVSPSSLSLLTPKGLTVEVEPVFCRMEGDQAVCAIRKDAGDDPDVTDGLLIVASVRKPGRAFDLTAVRESAASQKRGWTSLWEQLPSTRFRGR